MHNVERSAFRPGQYVGYGGGGVFRIRKEGGRWLAVEQNGTRTFYGGTLQEVSRKLDALPYAVRRDQGTARRDPKRDPKRRRGDLLGAHTTETALEKGLSAREQRLRRAAYAASHGELTGHDEPREPNPIEELYLRAIDAFRRRRPTLGFDLIERADHRALLRFGRSKRRPGSRWGA